jgi:hypothetical protein
VATNKWILFLPLAAMISVLAACSSGTANVQNPPPPPPSQVTIAFQPEPGASLAVGFSESLTAVVTNDPQNEGVDWNLVCQTAPGTCGTLSAAHTASGTATTYTAPATISTGSTVVEIVAFATVSQPTNVVAPISITTFDSSFPAGNYVLQAQGVQGSTPYQFAGVITLDGQGNVTAGEQTVNSNGASITDAITPAGSSYFLGSDGRGTITLVDPSAGTEIFSLVFLTNQKNPQAYISQTGVDTSGAYANGTMDLQTSTSAPTGSYAFVANGIDVLDNFVPLAFGGVLDIPAGGTTISGVTDEIIAGVQKLTAGTFATGSAVSAPDPFGQVTFTLVGLLGANHPKALTVTFAGYIVDATHIKLIETDTSATSLAPFGTTSGLAVAQAAGSYGNFNNASFAGTYVLGITGTDLSPINSGYIPSTWTTADLLTADGSGDLNGFTDTYLQQNCVQLTCTKGQFIPGAQISSSLTGGYSVDAGGTGRATLNGFNFISAPPSPSYSPTLFLYLTGNGSQPAALVLAVGDLTSNPKLHYPSIGTGVAFVQSVSTPDFSGDYGFRFTQVNSFSENDGTAQFNVSSSATPPLSGIGDSTTAPPPPNDPTVSDHLFTGTFGSALSDGALSGALANYNSFGSASDGLVFTVGNNDVVNDTGNLFDVNYYSVNQDFGFWIETDLVTGIEGNPGSGQVSFGYYAVRTPLCSSCP